MAISCRPGHPLLSTNSCRQFDSAPDMRRGEGSAQDRFPRTANDRRYRLYLLLHIHSEEPEKRAAKAPWSAARRNNPSGTVFLTGPRKGPGCLRAPSVDCPRFAQTPYMTGGVVPEI